MPRWTTVSYTEPPAVADPPPSQPPAGPDPPHPAQFMEVLEMLSRGETPANVRTDIADTPPDPTSSPTQGRITPRPKPWEQKTSPLREQSPNTWQPPPLPQASVVKSEEVSSG